MKIKVFLIVFVFFSLFFLKNSFAQRHHDTFADWSLFSNEYEGRKICYIAALPVQKRGNYNKRGEPYLVIINNNEDIDEVNMSSGYIYKTDSRVELSFGLKKFSAFTYGNLAWADDKVSDIEIIKAMRRGQDVVISGISTIGEYSKDTYSLIGFAKAYHKMKQICRR